MKHKHNYCRLAIAQPSAINVETRRIPAVASTEEVDSFGTVVSSTGWDLTRFLANPVLLFAHDGMTRTPVGHCENVRVEGQELLFDAVFDDTSAFDQEVWAKYAKGVMRGFSVRFDPVEHKTETRNGRDVMVYTRQILMEISCAPVPSNAGALTRTDNPNRCDVNRAEIMKALRALSEGEGEEAEKKAARALYEKMGGADGELKAREAGDAPADETKASGEEPPPESEKEKPAESQSAARAATVALAKRTAELEAAKERAEVASLVERNAGAFTPSLKIWALEQPLPVVRSYLEKAPNVQQRAAQAAAPTRGEGQGDATPPRTEESDKLDRILGIRKGGGDIGWSNTDNGVIQFRTATPEHLAKLQAERKHRRAV